MVNAVTSIIKLIDENNIRPMKKWSERGRRADSTNLSSQAQSIAKDIRHIMDILSGNDIVSMLMGLLFLTVISFKVCYYFNFTRFFRRFDQKAN